ncbi:MAG: sel1 repeat family protein [Lachnospiraceae bacterium]|nr:sel1 repeat family protein [Lachnospiraceae bacterium]
MTIEEAKSIVDSFSLGCIYTPEEEFRFVEAAQFLIKIRKDKNILWLLSGYYYQRHNFILSKKYLEMLAGEGETSGSVWQGYIWQEGYLGKTDYKKALEYFLEAAEKGDVLGYCKLAEMVGKGYGIDQDYEMYRTLVEKNYEVVRREIDNPLASTALAMVQLAEIKTKEKKKYEAMDLYGEAVDHQKNFTCAFPVVDNIRLLRTIIYRLYKMGEYKKDRYCCPTYWWFSPESYELCWLNGIGSQLDFDYCATCDECGDCKNRKERKHFFEVVRVNRRKAINFDGKLYRDMEDFWSNAAIGRHRMTSIAWYTFDSNITWV